MKKRSALTTVVSLSLAAAMIAGCGSSSSGSSSSGSGSEAVSADSAAAAASIAEIREVLDEDGNWTREYEGATLTFMDVNPGDVRTEYYTTLFEQFKEDTGITVEYQSTPWDGAADKMSALGAANQLPDIMTVWSGWLGQYTEAGWVEPLTEYIGDDTDEYSAAVTNILWESEKTRYGNIYTIPDGLMVKGIFVRKDWLDEYGIELDPTQSWTYDDYFTLIAQLTDESQGRYGNSYRGARGALDPLLTYMQNYTEGATYDSEGQILINSDECLEAFEKWTNVYLEGYAPQDAINWGFTEMVDNFVGGLSGTLMNDSEVAATLSAQLEDDQWMVMPIPTSEKDGKIYNNMTAPYSYAMSANCESKGAAWELMMYLTTAENQAEYCQQTGEIPIKKDAADLDLYAEDGPYATFIQQLNDPNLAVPATFGPFDYTELHQGLFHEEIQSYLLGDESAADALNNITDALQEKMDEYLEENPDATIETALTM